MMAQTYTVKSGDTVNAIARQFGVLPSAVTGYRSGDANRIGVGENLSINTGVTPPVNTINAQNLNSQPYTVPQSRTATGYYGLNGLIKNTQDTITALTPKADQSEKDFQTTVDQLGGQNKRRADLYVSEGVNTAKQELDAINQTMRAREQAYIAKIDRIRSNNPNGAFQAGQDIEIDKATKDHAIERSADAITAEYKLGNYTNAKTIVDQLVDAETEDLKIKLEGQKYFMEKNDAKLSDAQKTLLQEQTAQTEQEYNDKKDTQKDLASIALKLAEAGGSGTDIANIFKSGDVSKAIALAAPFLGANSGGSFTTTQTNSGAANAGVDLATFKGFDADTKNFFINGNINASKKSIDDAFKNDGASLEDVQATIKDMGLTPKGEEFLLNYADKAAKQNAPLTPEQTTQTLVGSLTSLKTSGYTRGEAYDAISNELTNSGKTKLPKAMENSIQDALVSVFGRTFWQKVLPYGR